MINALFLSLRRGGDIGETDEDTQSGSATDIIGTSEVCMVNPKFRLIEISPLLVHFIVLLCKQYANRFLFNYNLG